MISLAFLTTWGQSGASGCRTINHWQLGARKPYGARLFGVFALVQIGFKFPFGERRIGEFGRKARDAPDRRAGVFREAQPADIVGRRCEPRRDLVQNSKDTVFWMNRVGNKAQPADIRNFS
jgi:hypothetical protein